MVEIRAHRKRGLIIFLFCLLTRIGKLRAKGASERFFVLVLIDGYGRLFLFMFVDGYGKLFLFMFIDGYGRVVVTLFWLVIKDLPCQRAFRVRS